MRSAASVLQPTKKEGRFQGSASVICISKGVYLAKENGTNSYEPPRLRHQGATICMRGRRTHYIMSISELRLRSPDDPD